MTWCGGWRVVCYLACDARQEVRKLVDFLMPLASAEELHFTEEDLKANRFGLEVGHCQRLCEPHTIEPELLGPFTELSAAQPMLGSRSLTFYAATITKL